MTYKNRMPRNKSRCARPLKKKTKNFTERKMYVEQVKLLYIVSGSKIGTIILENSVVFTEAEHKHTLTPPSFTFRYMYNKNEFIFALKVLQDWS